MATDTPGPAAGRPRPWLLVLLGVVVAAYLLSRMFSAPAARPAVTSAGTRPSSGSASARVDPAELDVKIETLAKPPAGPRDGDRNPFRFQPKAPPPPPPGASQAQRPVTPAPDVPQEPQGPPPPAPIGSLIKFIGIVDTGGTKVGAFSDCRYTFPGREGEVIEGRFRVVRIGIESAILEYTDGRGRATLPLNGQACVGK